MTWDKENPKSEYPKSELCKPAAHYNKSRAKRGIPCSDLGFRKFGFKLVLALILLFYLSSLAQAFSFAVFGDNHGNLRMLSDIFTRIKADRDIQFAVNVGDMVNRGDASQFKAYADFVNNSGVKVYHVMGNHDAYNGDGQFIKYFGRTYYSFDHENAHFIVLNNALNMYFDETQLDFLEKDLEANKGRGIFVFFHKPAFDPSNVYREFVMSDRRLAVKMMDLFKKYKVRYVSSGHIHAYLRSESSGVVYLVTGGGGGVLHLPAFMGGFYHYVKITVDGDKVKDEVVKLYDQ